MHSQKLPSAIFYVKMQVYNSGYLNERNCALKEQHFDEKDIRAHEALARKACQLTNTGKIYSIVLDT